MSHSISVTIQHVDLYIKNCDTLINELKKDKERTKEIYNSQFHFDDWISKVEELKELIKSFIGKEFEQSLMNKISTIEKEVTHIRYLLENTHNTLINNILNQTTFNFTSAIAKYGTMTYDAIDYLKKNNININDENFEKAISEIRHELIKEEKKQEYLTKANSLINESELSDEAKLLLKQEIRSAKTSQEISDVLPLIESKKSENDRLVMMYKEFNKKLKEEGFTINKNKIKQLGVDSYSNMYIKYSMINPSRNSIDIIMNSDGKIKYKLGNYVGHMCNKTSEQLINKLRKDGWSVAINSIKRDISNSRQLVMERELK